MLATITQKQQGPMLTDSPAVFTITVAKVSGSNFTDSHKTVIMTVKHGDALISEVEIPVSEGSLDVDIHEAIRGWFISKNYDCSTLAKLKADVKDETFTVSVRYKSKRTDNSTGSVSLYIESGDASAATFTAREGGLTEYAIFTYGASDRTAFADLGYSLKPKTMETVNHEEVPYPFDATTGHKYFAEETKNYRRKRFFFINSCGVLESASLLMCEEKDIKYETNTHKLYKEASFSYTPHISAVKTSTTSWKMSSGYCTTDWCEWFAGEFAFAKHFWMEETDGKLLPVTISVDTTTAYNKAKGSLGSVNFTVTQAV